MKKIYWQTVLKKALLIGIPVGVAGFSLLFWYLSALGVIEITGHSGDVICAGTLEDPCYAYINFTAKEDIFIYPMDYDPWGRDTPFETDKELESWKMYRSWGTGWREIKLNETCTGTWCGAPDNKGVAYSFVFREGRDYQIRIVAYKENSYEDIKWGFGPIDPTWYGIDERDIGYNILNDTVVIWNTQDAYYFNKSSGIQFTNYYEDYWSRNIFCIGYYAGGNWYKIKCADELNNFNRNIQTDNYTYVNATLWKDISYGSYDLRFGVRYYLGLNDENLSITVYMKNIGIDIPFDLGFAWKVGNLDVPPNETTDKIRINNTIYRLDGTYDLTFKEMKRYVNMSFPTNQTDSNGSIIYNYSLVEIPLPFYKIYDYSGGLTGKENFLRIDWDENLPYAVKLHSEEEQSNSYALLLINAGHFSPQQEKSTTFYWIDAVIDGIISYYKLDETSGAVIDSVGFKNGTNTGAVPNTAGKINTAYDFELGDNDDIDLGESEWDSFFQNDFTISVWIKPESVTGSSGIVSKWYDAPTRVFSLGTGNAGGGTANRVGIRYDLSGSTGTLESAGTTIAAGNWYHIVAIKSSAGMKIYINGSEKASTGNEPTTTNNAQFYIGNAEFTGARQYPFDGIIDEVGLWNSVKTPGEITELYNDFEGYPYPFVEDLTPPTYSNNGVNNTIAGEIAKFYLLYDDETALEPNGQWIFSTNNTGTWTNESAVNFTATPSWANVTKTLNSTAGLLVGYRWYAHDNAANYNNTGVFTLTTTDVINPVASFGTNPVDTYNSSSPNITFDLKCADETGVSALILYGNWTGTWHANQTNSSPVNDNFWNVTVSGIPDGIGYIWAAWCNDTSDNEDFTDTNRTFTIDTINPLIEFVDPTPDNHTITTDANYIFVNVSVTETNPQNITFYLYNSTDLRNETTYLMETQTSNTTINFTNLEEEAYYYNVTVVDFLSHSNSTETREYYITTFRIFLNEVEGNTTAELGTLLELLANSTVNISIYVDIDHPDFGYNYSSGTGSANFNLTIDYFRNNLFSDDKAYSELEFDYINETSGRTEFSISNFTIPIHQYDTINNVSVNLSGEINKGNSTDESKIIIYKANSSEIDRAFYGEISGDQIYESMVFDNNNGTDLYLSNTNVSFQNYGDQVVYFYLDDNAELTSFILNISGFEYGFTFDNNSFGDYKDEEFTNATTIANHIFPGKSGTSGWLNYGQFNNEGVWSFSDEDYIIGDDGYHYCEEYATTKGSSSMTAYLDLDGSCCSIYEEQDSATINPYVNLFNYTDILSSKSLEELVIHFTLDIDGEEGLEGGKYDHCDWDFEFLLGGLKIMDHDEGWFEFFVSHNRCYDEEALGICTFTEDYDVTFTIERNQEDSDYLYTVTRNGTISSYADFDQDDCDWIRRDMYLNTGTWYISSNPGCGSEANGTITGLITQHTPSDTTALSLFNSIHGTVYTVPFNTGCRHLSMGVAVDNVSVQLNSYENSTYTSTSVFDSSAVINELNISVGGNFDGPTFISADLGEHWQEANLNESNIISYPGKNIKWRQNINPNTGYLSVVPYVNSISISTEKDHPSNVSLDFGNDGAYEYTMSGYLQGANQTLTANLTLADISDSFTGSAIEGQTWLIPLRVFSDTAGIVNLNNMNLTYDPNPVYLNLTSIRNYAENIINFSTLDIEIEAINGTINLTDLRYDYKGGNSTIEITARDMSNTLNETIYLMVYFSDFYNLLPYTWTEDIFFLPRTNSSKNVSAYGQSLVLPIYNVTTTNYGGKNSNLSIKVDKGYDCLNLTWSNTNVTPANNKITTTWQVLGTDFPYLSNILIWLWADLENCDPTDEEILNPSIDISSYCSDCLWSEP